MQFAVDSLQTSTKSVQALASSMDSAMTKSFEIFGHRILEQLKSLVKEEISGVLDEHKSCISNSVMEAMRVGAMTPSIGTPYNMEMEIEQYLKQEDYNKAFQEALTAADLSLVIFVCEKVNPSVLFDTTPCALEQPVLLSLIQQFSNELENKCELKLLYLKDAVMNLDSNHHVTKEHMGKILESLCHKLKSHMTSNPGDPYLREMRIVHMMAQSFL